MEGAQRLLRSLGFSTYEAKVLVALQRKHPANGYEISKLAAIPTSKVYSILADLKHGGFVATRELSGSTLYEPIPLDELTSKIRSTYDRAILALDSELRGVAPLPELELSWNLRDYDAVLGRLERLVREGRRRVMLSIWPEERLRLQLAMDDARARGLEVIVASFGPVEGCGPLAMDISACGRSSERRLGTRLTVALRDSDEVVISEIKSKSDTVGLWTSSPEIVLVAKEYIKHDLWGRALIEEVGEEAFARLCGGSELLRLLLESK